MTIIEHPISTFDVGWQPEILSPIARLPAGLYSLSFIYLEKARQSFFSQTVEAKNMADFWRIMTPFDAIWRHFYGNG